MSSQDRQFLPFAEFEPDSIDFDNPKLDVAENVTPSYGAYRPIEQLAKRTSVTDSNSLTGGYAHLTGQPTPNINLFPEGEGITSPAMVENHYVKDMILLDDAGIESFGVDQVTGPAIDDTTWIRTPPMNEGAGGGTLYLKFPETPREPAAVTGNVKIKIRLRLMGELLADDTHRIDYELFVDGASFGVPVAGTWTYTGSDNEWQDFEVDLTDANITDITDWDTIELEMLSESTIDVTGTEVNNVPVADEYFDVGWGNEDGEQTDMWDSINHMVADLSPTPDYTKYIESGQIPPDGDSTIIFRYGDVSLPADPEANGNRYVSWYTANKDNVEIKMRIVQATTADAEGDSTFWLFSGQNYVVLYEKIVNGISTDQSTPTVTVMDETESQGYDWTQNADPTKFVYVAFTATYAGGGGTEGEVEGEAYMVPTTEQGNSPWSGNVSDIDNVTDGDESNATNANMSINHSGNPDSFTLNMSDGPNATDRSNGSHVLHVRAQGVADTSIRMKLLEGTTEIDNSAHHENPLDTSWEWHTMSLSASKAASIGVYDNLRVKIYAGGDGVVEVSEVYFSYPGDSAQVRIYENALNSEQGAHFEISDLRLEVVDPKDSNVGDLNEIYVGTSALLYDVSDFGFTDVTRVSADYGEATLDDIPKPWHFTSWGDDTIATNYADKLQRRALGATNFDDLIHASSPYAPRARFCAVIAGSLVLAGISPSAYADADRPYTDGKPFHLWSSYLLQPDYFDTADYDNQSAIFPLISKPGAITGLVGGEYGWVFKRNSIWRMTYVGLPPIFQFDLIAEGVGCGHPNSIVSAGGDVYFWGGGAIHSVGPSGYRRLSGLRVEKYLFDSLYEPTALMSTYTSDTVVNDTLVWGAFDAYSGLIWWLYRTPGDDQNKLNRAVIYSIIEDRFTTVYDPDIDLTLILGQQNVVTNEPVLNRSMLAFKYGDTVTDYMKFTADNTYTGTLKSKIITPHSWGMDVGRDAEVVAVRPMYTSQPGTSDDYRPTALPNFKITITASQDPSLRIGNQTRVVNRVVENRQGWIPVEPVNGEFWQFEVEYPELNRATIKEFLGLQLLTNRRGDG